MTDQIIINGKAIVASVAITYEEQARGLMFQKDPQPMVFVYAVPSYNQMWMKNCPVGLDMVFALRGKVVGVRSGLPHSTALIGVESLSDLIVELPAGQAKTLGIKSGDVITSRLSEPTLKKFVLNGNGISY